MSAPRHRRPPASHHRRRRLTQQPPIGLIGERCSRCNQELATATGCTPSPYPTSPPWGEEAFWHDQPDLEPLPRCPYCWTSRGQHHHHDCLRAWCDPCATPLYNCPHGQEDPD